MGFWPGVMLGMMSSCTAVSAFPVTLLCESDITHACVLCAISPSLLTYIFLEVRGYEAFLYHAQQNIIHRPVTLEIRNKNECKIISHQ